VARSRSGVPMRSRTWRQSAGILIDRLRGRGDAGASTG
jgi:hypothetical protein